MNRLQERIRIGLLTFLTAAFIVIGILKLMNNPHDVAEFTRWGYPLWFMYFAATCEILFAIGLHIQKTFLTSAVGLVVIMMGAITSHVINNDPLLAPIPATVLMLMVLGIIFLTHLKPKVTS